MVEGRFASAQWTAAVDAAMTELAQDAAFQKEVTSIGVPFVVPLCKQTANYPSKNPIPSNITSLIICHEPQPATNLWRIVYHVVGKGLLANLNKRYGLSLGVDYLMVNTSAGYFNSLRDGVDSGLCDMVVSDTALSPTRSSQVTFATCPYGVTYYAYLRTDLDNTTITGINTLDQLNRADVKISWWKGTLFDKVMNDSLPLVQNYPASTMEDMFLNAQNKLVHAILFDAVDLYSWMNDHTAYCASCYVRVFGEPPSVQIFTKKFPAISAAPGIMQDGSLTYLLIMAFLIIYSLFV